MKCRRCDSESHCKDGIVKNRQYAQLQCDCSEVGIVVLIPFGRFID